MAREDLSKRGKVGGVYRSGSFKGKKAANLSKAQLKRATTARGKKVSQKAVTKATSAKRTSISQTQFEKGRGVTKDGKLFTGRVKLASGKTATYVRGRRVVAGKKAAAPARGRSGSGSRGGTTTPTTKRNVTTTRVTPSQRGEGAGNKPSGTRSRAYVHDSFQPDQGIGGRTSLERGIRGVDRVVRGGRNYSLASQGIKAPKDRKRERGAKYRLQKDRSGQSRWVKVV